MIIFFVQYLAVWFHGDALNLTADRIEHIIGFKCYTCLQKRPPVCPHQFPTGNGTEHTGEDADSLVHVEDGSTDQLPYSNNEAEEKR